MKKLFFAIVLGALLTNSLVSMAKSENDSGKLNIVTTTFPAYDWTKNVIGEHADLYKLDLLSDKGVGVHSFQPSVADIVELTTSDLLVYIGGEAEYWVDEALHNEGGKVSTTPLNLIEEIRSISPSLLLQVEHHHDADCDHDHDAEVEEHDHDHDAECTDEHCTHDHEEGFIHDDEHIWLSLKRAQLCVTAIAEYVSALDPANENDYYANARNYNKELEALSKEYQIVIDEADEKTLIFGDRFPFVYFADDYGIHYHAAFSGCSSETEASFETIANLAGMVDSHNLNYIMAVEGSQSAIADTIAANTVTKDQKILYVNALEIMTKAQIEKGATYIGIMKENLEVFTKAFQN